MLMWTPWEPLCDISKCLLRKGSVVRRTIQLVLWCSNSPFETGLEVQQIQNVNFPLNNQGLADQQKLSHPFILPNALLTEFKPCIIQVIGPIQKEMEDFMIDFKEIDNEDAANTVTEVFVGSVLDEKGLKVNVANDFFSQCLHNLENPSTSPKAKFYTIYMLKELSYKEAITRKLFGPFSKHALYNYIQDLALNVDPKKVIEEKGKSLFPSDKTTGNNFMRLILESLVNWCSRFGTIKGKPNRFTTTNEKLNKAKIVVPSNNIYYQKLNKQETPSGEEAVKEETKKYVSQESVSTPSAPKVKEPKQKYASEIRFMFNKIQTLQSILEDEEEVDVIQKEVTSYHQKFTKDHEKLKTQQEEMLENQSEDILGLYFKLVDFFEEENKLYSMHAKNNDYATYISGYAIAVEKIFEMSKLKEAPKKLEPSIDSKMRELKKEEPSIGSKIKDSKAVPPSKGSLPPSKPSIKSEIASNENLRKKESKTYERESKINEANKAMDTFFSRLEDCSKSPQNGFKDLAKSMSSEKQSALLPRKRNPMAVSNFSKSRFGASSVAKSVAQQLKGIFAVPPNSNVRAKNYEGQLVLEIGEFDIIRENVLKVQGHRRFKCSHFKQKYILYEDNFIQIGFKASQIYQKVQKFSAMLLFQLYIGNKCDKLLKKLSLQFHGDKQSLIYTSPRVIDEKIMPEGQIKMELLNIPKKIPFGHITVQVSFDVEWEAHHISVYLPNSILQMVTYFEVSSEQYPTSWAECVKIMKTEAFPLCHHFPPNQLKTMVPSLRQLSKYSDFEREGSTTDYELVTEVIIQQSHQGILKIIVRPDLTVVLQVGIYESEENCLKNFRFYLQALQMALRE